MTYTRESMIEDTADGWRERMEIFAAQMPEQVWLGEPAKTGSTYFQQNWEPVITCSHEVCVDVCGGVYVCVMIRLHFILQSARGRVPM